MNEIKRIFTIENIQYACVAQEISDMNDEACHLHIQIILKQTVNKKTWFLDTITRMFALKAHRILLLLLIRIRRRRRRRRKIFKLIPYRSFLSIHISISYR